MHPTMQRHILLKDKNSQFKMLFKCSLQLRTTYVNNRKKMIFENQTCSNTIQSSPTSEDSRFTVGCVCIM